MLWTGCRRPFTCFYAGMVTMLYGWALGQGLDFRNVGLRIGSGSSYTLSTLQMHYSNPLAAAGVNDSSGLELTLTPTLREHDAAVIAVGVAIGPGGIRIPPRQSAFAVQVEGTLSLNAPVQAFTFSLHAHKAGTRLYAWVLRDGAVTQLIGAEDPYAFDLQSMRRWPSRSSCALATRSASTANTIPSPTTSARSAATERQ